MSQLMAFLYNACLYIANLLQSLALTLKTIVLDSYIWLFDKLLSAAIPYLNSSFGDFDFNPMTYINALPPIVLQVIGLCGLGTCMNIIISALTIRISLQLIPFLRWGS